MKTPRRLNTFQSLMRAWTELAPYSFIHAVRLEEPADAARWHAAVRAVLPVLELDPRSFSIESPAVPIDVHLAAELNRPFAPGDLPLRFFLLPAEGSGHWFGVVIDHWFADDFTARAWLQWIVDGYHGTGSVPPPVGSFWAERPPRGRGWWMEGMNLLQQGAALRSARRIPLRDPLDFTVGVLRAELPAETLEAARQCAREAGATVHDVFLAAAAQACAQLRPAAPGSRRDGLGLASAIDLRRFETSAAGNTGGLLISQYVIVETRPDEVPMPDLVARIARKTRLLKAASGRAVLCAGLLFWRLSRTPWAKATLHLRGAPLAAGLSNVNLSGSWLEQAPIAEFRRVAPAGPAVPFVFMITTWRGRIAVDATYRTTAFSRPEAERLLEDFAQRLQPAERAG